MIYVIERRPASAPASAFVAVHFEHERADAIDWVQARQLTNRDPYAWRITEYAPHLDTAHG